MSRQKALAASPGRCVSHTGAALDLSPFSRQEYLPAYSVAELCVHVAGAATVQLTAEGAGWRAACCAIQLSTCCRSIHSVADCAVRRSCQRGKGKVNHRTLNKFPLIPSGLDILEESWEGAWRFAKRRAWLLSAGTMGQSQGMGGVEEQDLCTSVKL